MCHERDGKLATASVEFIEVAARANAEHNPEREAAARQRAGTLEPRLSHLVVRVDAATAGLAGLTSERAGSIGAPRTRQPELGHSSDERTAGNAEHLGRTALVARALEERLREPRPLGLLLARTGRLRRTRRRR